MNSGMQTFNTSPSHKEGEFCIDPLYFFGGDSVALSFLTKRSGVQESLHDTIDSCMRRNDRGKRWNDSEDLSFLTKRSGVQESLLKKIEPSLRERSAIIKLHFSSNTPQPPLPRSASGSSTRGGFYLSPPLCKRGLGGVYHKIYLIFRKFIPSLKPSVVKLALFLLFFLSTTSFSYQTTDSLETQEQVLTDSITVKDAEPLDTIPPNTPLVSHGSNFTLNEMNTSKISKQDIQYINYANFPDILKRKMRQFPLFLGGYGEFNSFSIYGGNPRNISVAFNGRPIDDFAFSTMNLSQIAPEFMENAEILTGTDAILYSNDASSALINLQEIIYNTKYPFTKIWISEANFDYISADGVFSQNFSKNWNFTFGFRTQTSAGRYENSWLDSWNVRALLRWNPSDRTSISFVESFTNQGFGTTGGIENTGEDYCDDLIAFPIYEQVDERVFRHDLTLSLTSILDRDSSHAISGSVFLSNSDWDRRRSIDMLINENDSSLYYSHSSFFVGANARYENNLLEFTKLSIGGDVRFIALDGTDYIESFSGLSASAFGRLKINFTDDISITGGLRLKAQHEKYAASLGGKIEYNMSQDILLSADLSYSERFPSASEGLMLNNEKNFLGLFKFQWQAKESRLSFTAFARQIFSPIMAEPVFNSSGVLINTIGYNGTDLSVAGATVEATTPISEGFFLNTDKLIVGGWANIQLSMGDDGTSKRFPVFYGGLELYYELIIGRSEARIGASIELLSAFKGESFFPIKRTYFASDFEKGFSTNGTELFAAARLGSNAYVKLSLENPLSQCYYYVPIHPMYEMNFKVSVSWSFMD